MHESQQSPLAREMKLIRINAKYGGTSCAFPQNKKLAFRFFLTCQVLFCQGEIASLEKAVSLFILNVQRVGEVGVCIMMVRPSPQISNSLTWAFSGTSICCWYSCPNVNSRSSCNNRKHVRILNTLYMHPFFVPINAIAPNCFVFVQQQICMFTNWLKQSMHTKADLLLSLKQTFTRVLGFGSKCQQW